MLDIYVVTILSALVQIDALATINVGPGAVAFGGVVVLTMLATLRFDPRLIWDEGEKQDEKDADASETEPKDGLTNARYS